MEIRVATLCSVIGKQWINLEKGEMIFQDIRLEWCINNVAFLMYAKEFTCTPQCSPFFFYMKANLEKSC